MNNKKKTLKEFITESQLVHGLKYDYSLVEYTGMHNHVIIICDKNHEFTITPAKHIHRKQGCPDCYKQKVKLGIAKTDEQIKNIIDKANIVHNNFYDYSRITEIYQLDKKYEIICPKHNKSFFQSLEKHLQGQGCPLFRRDQRKTLEQFIDQSNIVHNFQYDYSKTIYKDAHSHVDILCKKHNEIFKQTPNNHLKGNGCPACNTPKRKSKAALQWLKTQGCELQLEYRIPENKRYSADGFCYATNTIYLFHGTYWHGDPRICKKTDVNSFNKKTFGELYKTTIERENLLKSFGYNLIVMWELEWTKIWRILNFYGKYPP